MSTTTKPHISVTTTGHVDAGKSTTCGQLIFQLGGIPDREMEKLKKRAEELGKQSFSYAFYMDTTKEEQERGITIKATTKEFFTNNYHYTIIDSPGHADFIKNMISGSSQADVGLLLVPADGNFATSIAKGTKETKIGQSRQHSRLLNLLGIQQLCVLVNKIDAADYSEARFNEVRDEVKDMLVKTGWPKKFVDEKVPIIPYSAWQAENMITKSENEKMSWWKGVDVVSADGSTTHVDCVLDALDKHVKVPKRHTDKPLRVPISGVYKIKGVGDVLAGRIESGSVKPGDEVVFLPKHTETNPCTGKVFSVEQHHKQLAEGLAGENVGMNIKGLSSNYMPETGDVMVLKKDLTAKPVKQFTATVQVLDHPGELKVGYSPVIYARTAKSACKLVAINWKIGKETGNQKLEKPTVLKANEAAELVFEPLHGFFVEEFAKCEGLGRIAVMDSGTVVMIGKVTGTA